MELNIILGLLMFSSIGYLFVIMIITKGWFKLEKYSPTAVDRNIEVSLVIAVRNEEQNIVRLLESIYRQSYAHRQIEIIIVDDHSEDNTRHLIGKFRQENRVDNIILSKPKGIGKKAAITHGVKLATGQLILTTDGDCVLMQDWLKNMVGFYLENKPGLIIGPVVYHHEKGLFQKLFSIDFLGLVASGAGSIGANLPLMGNGANMAFSRKAFLEIESSMKGGEFASGDDVFLIHQMTKNFGEKSIHFIKDPAVIVKTKAPAYIGQFLSQRIRWASKAKGYRTKWSVVVPLAVSLFNLMLGASFVAGLMTPWFFSIFALFLMLKFLIDIPILFDFMKFSGKRNLLIFIFPLEIIYPFYIIFTAIVSLFYRYEWKGRRGLK